MPAASRRGTAARRRGRGRGWKLGIWMAKAMWPFGWRTRWMDADNDGAAARGGRRLPRDAARIPAYWRYGACSTRWRDLLPNVAPLPAQAAEALDGSQARVAQ